MRRRNLRFMRDLYGTMEEDGPQRGERGYDGPDHDLEWHGRTRWSHPYSYDPFTILGEPYPDERCNGSDYTDRLHEWAYGKYDRLAAELFQEDGQRINVFLDHKCRGDLIQEFLRRYWEDETIELLRVIAYCNAGNGFPLWRLDYHSAKVAQRAAEREAQRRAEVEKLETELKEHSDELKARLAP